GLEHISFVTGDLQEIALAKDFDAVVGRLILMHLTQPGPTLRHVVSHLRPGGLVALLEVDINLSQFLATHPATPQGIVDIHRWREKVLAPLNIEKNLMERLPSIF